MRASIVFLVACACVVILACGGDSSGTAGNSQSDLPPSSCVAPCKVGTICSGPAEPACDGTWYCWSDTQWHCAPPTDGGPGGFPPDATVDAPAVDSSTPDARGG